MREFKFRAWSEGRKRFDDPARLGLMADGSASYYIDKTSTWFDVAGFTHELLLEQFTGQRDKSGREIYEGDVVRYVSPGDDYFLNEPSFGVVEFGDAEFVVRELRIGRLKYREYVGETIFTNDFYSQDGRNFSWNELEVVGNIHENPELL